VESGVIGELKTGWVLHSVGAGSNWYFHDWHGEIKNTGGLLLQKGSHDFDIINWMVAARINKITAFGSRDFFGGDKPNDLICQSCSENKTCSEAVKDWYYSWNTPKGNEAKILYNRWRNKCAFRSEIDVPDNHQVLLEYENGVKITYLECHYTPEDNREYTFIGTKGKVKLDSISNTVTVQLRKDMYDRNAKMVYSETQAQNADDVGNYRIVDDFIKALTSGEQPKAGGVDGFYAVQVGILAHESIKSGKMISIKKLSMPELNDKNNKL
jgi:predicted dehydrogenase